MIKLSFSRSRHGSNDLEPFTLEFNTQTNETNKNLNDDEGNRQASESLFRSLPELRYRYYVLNAACIFFAILVIQALIFEKYRELVFFNILYILLL
jgi:hypothetical protein